MTNGSVPELTARGFAKILNDDVERGHVRVPVRVADPHEHDRPAVDLQTILVRHGCEEASPLLLVEVPESAFPFFIHVCKVEPGRENPFAMTLLILS
jgi:hypothetical protein